jgi:hypothetical protein
MECAWLGRRDGESRERVRVLRAPPRSRASLASSAMPEIARIGLAAIVVMLTLSATGARAADAASPSIRASVPGTARAGGVVAARVSVTRAPPGARVRLEQRVARRWVVRSAAVGIRRGRAVLHVRAPRGPASIVVRASLTQGRRRVAVSAVHTVMLSVTARVTPDRATKLSAGAFALEIPRGTVSAATTASVTPVNGASSGVPGTAVRFHIAGRWTGRGKTVRVTLPLDPDVRARGSDVVPVVIHVLADGSARLLAGRSLRIAGDRVSYDSANLSIFSSFSLPRLSLPSLGDVIDLDLGKWLGDDLAAFLGAHTDTPRCAVAGPGSGVTTSGSAFKSLGALDGQPTLKHCASADGRTATWTLANNTGAVLALSIGGTGATVHWPKATGDPLLDAVFGRMNRAINPGGQPSTPVTLALPPGGAVDVSVKRSSTASIELDESPPATLGAFVLSQMGAPLGAANDLYEALKLCGIAPKVSGPSPLALLRCLLASVKLSQLGARVVKALGRLLLGFEVAIKLKQRLNIGHRTGTLGYASSNSGGDVTSDPGAGQDGGSGSPGGGSAGGGSPGGDGPSTDDDGTPGGAVTGAFTQIAPSRDGDGVGGEHTCAIRQGGSVSCWGSGRNGESSPPAGAFEQLASGLGFTCGLLVDHTADCWGRITDSPSGTFASIAAGGYDVCAVRSDGSALCWARDHGEPMQPPDADYRQIVPFPDGFCGLHTDGTVACWGTGPEPLPPALPGTYTQIAMARATLCGLTAAGSVTCVASGGAAPQLPPGTYRSINGGRTQLCGVRTDGTAGCFGSVSIFRPGSPPFDHFATVAIGSAVGCGVRSDGTAVCWGNDSNGAATPPGVLLRSLSSGGYQTSSTRTCGVTLDGYASCWGNLEEMSPGVPSEPVDGVAVGQSVECWLLSTHRVTCSGWTPQPATDPPAIPMAAVSAGPFYACGLTDAGEVKCWGYTLRTPGPSPSGAFTSVTAGTAHACALRSDGTAVCWGHDDADRRYPTDPSPAGRFTQLAAGAFYTCGLLTDRTVRCWTAVPYPTAPMDAPSGTFTRISAGSAHACGLRTDGSAVCWGYDEYGETAVPAGAYSDIAAGSATTCALLQSGIPRCWGVQVR